MRLYIYEGEKLIGQDYQRENGEWMHKWVMNGVFERGSWRGRCAGENSDNWRYEEFNESELYA